ncbi:MAG: S-layer homology domain-containing protein [Defluviitaleaceae bacterium]|nr:S-layer homology domain-containing protein [Defluviitaleaceae bacterium]
MKLKNWNNWKNWKNWKNLKKKLAMFLALVLAISSVSVASIAFANEDTSILDFIGLPNLFNATAEIEFATPPAIGGTSEVIFNLGRQEVTVGFDTQRAAQTPWNYRLFDSFGNFTIQLEDNAFFPYEVQFQYQGVTFIEWFDTPQSTVQVGNHIFSVATVQNNPNLLQSISLIVGNDVIVLRPVPKQFFDAPFEPASLLPLRVVELDPITLSYIYDRFQFNNVRVSSIVSSAAGNEVVWVRHDLPNEGVPHQIIDNGIIDLSRPALHELEFIVGSAAQLDPENVRYRISVLVAPPSVVQSARLYHQNDGTRVLSESTNLSGTGESQTAWLMATLVGTTFTPHFLDFTIDPMLRQNYTVEVVHLPVGFANATLAEIVTLFETEPDRTVTSQVLDQNMSTANSGFQVNQSGGYNFAILFMQGGNAVGLHRFNVNVGQVVPANQRVANFRIIEEIDGNRGNFVQSVSISSSTTDFQAVSISRNLRGFGINPSFIAFDIGTDPDHNLADYTPQVFSIDNNTPNNATAAEILAAATTQNVTSNVLNISDLTATSTGFRIDQPGIYSFAIFFENGGNVEILHRLDVTITVPSFPARVSGISIVEEVGGTRLVHSTGGLFHPPATPPATTNPMTGTTTRTINLSAAGFGVNPHYFAINLHTNYDVYTPQIVQTDFTTLAEVQAAVDANPALDVTDRVIGTAQLQTNPALNVELVPGTMNFAIIFRNPANANAVVGFHRLILTVNVPSIPSRISEIRFVDETGGSRGGLISPLIFTNPAAAGTTTTAFTRIVSDGLTAPSRYFGITLNSAYAAYRPLAVRGDFETSSQAVAAYNANNSLDVTNRLIYDFLTDLASLNTGVAIAANTTEHFGIVFYDSTNTVVGFQRLSVTAGSAIAIQNVGVYEQTADNLRISLGVPQHLTLYEYTFTLRGFETNVTETPHYIGIVLAPEFIQSSDDVQVFSGHFATAAAAVASGTNVTSQIVLQNLTELATANSGVRATAAINPFTIVFFVGGQPVSAINFTVELSPRDDSLGEPFNPGERDPWFNVLGAVGLENYYIVPYEHDTYFAHGFQTVLFLDTNVDLSQLVPTFDPDPQTDALIFAGTIGNPGARQFSGQSSRDFSGGPVQYAAITPLGSGLRNYWVTFVPQFTGGGRLFVNGINGPIIADPVNNPRNLPTREVFLNERHNNVHDIFIANVGNAPLTGLRAELTLNPTANNAALDRYWTVGGTGNDTLAAFTTTDPPAAGYEGELPNVAKIRIIQNGSGEIEGILTITADGQPPIEIRITGQAGDPVVTTTTLDDAVLYVPYQAIILNSNMYPWNRVRTIIIEGEEELENIGMELRPSGELYGIPTGTGEFAFTVELQNSNAIFANTRHSFVLRVLSNDDNELVAQQTDVGHEITDWVGLQMNGYNVVMDVASEAQRTFLTAGLYAEFIRFWLNGEPLVSGVDYIAEPGSTRIIIQEQTFERARPTGPNTIAAEFRVNADEGTPEVLGGRLNRAAQNFTLVVPPQPTNPPTGGGGNQGGGNNQGGGGGNQGGGNQGGNVGNAHETDGEIPIQPPRPTTNNAGGQGNQANQGNQGNQANQGGQTQPPAPEPIPQPTPQPPIVPVIPPPIANVVTLPPFESTGNTAGFLLPMEVVRQYVVDGNISIVLDTGILGRISLNQAALIGLSALTGEMFHFTIVIQNGQAILQIMLDDTPVSTVNGGLRVVFPNIVPFAVPEDEIIVLLNANGTAVPVRKAFVENGMVYALITQTGTISTTSNFTQFNDIEPANWFASVVQFVVNRGALAVNSLLSGVGNLFNPNVPATRAETVHAFFEIEDTIFFGGNLMFNDISVEDVHSTGINWAATRGIIQGFGDGTFRPNENITRQQIAIVLMNYANSLGLDTTARGYMGNFGDASQVAPWADDAVRWAVAVGLMQGDGANLNPNSNATRAEVSQIVRNMVRFVVR